MIGLVLAAAVATGSWSLSTTNDGHTQLRTTWTDDSGNHSSSYDGDVDAKALGITPQLGSSGSHVRFSLHREAGDFEFEGWVGTGNGGGTYAFTPNDAFFDSLRKRGISLDNDNPIGREMSLASLNVSLAYVDELLRTGVALDMHSLITFRALDIDGAYINDLASAGFSHLQTHEYVRLKAMNINGAYVKTLASHGFSHLTVEQLIRLKSLQIE